MSEQLTLPVDLPDIADFSNFIPGENKTVISALQHFVNESEDNVFYLWGAEGSGLTHLLMAVCQLVVNAAYISFSHESLLDVSLLEGVENIPLVCFDDIDHVAGDKVWEHALFHCYNRVISCRHKMIVAAHCSPAQLTIQLPDLKSRLAAGSVYKVEPLDDEDKIVALKARAALHGVEMTDEVAKYLLNHSERNAKSLFNALTRLEKENLSHHRRLTIPFLKEVLELKSE